MWASISHVAFWESCRGPHEIFDLEIATSPGNDLSNVILSEVDLQKKIVLYLSSISTPSPHLPASLFRNRVLGHEVMLISKK